MRSFAISHTVNGRAVLWCVGKPEAFDVLNGMWEGSLSNNVLRITEKGQDVPGFIVWEGDAPFNAKEYNEALKWIRDQQSNVVELAS